MASNGYGYFAIDRFTAPKIGGSKRDRSKAKQRRASRKRNR